MMHHLSTSSNQLHYYATAAYPCNYLDGYIARSQVAQTAFPIDDTLYSDLIGQGFRRSGSFIYRPHCDHCHACTSMRVPVTEFRADRSQRRSIKQHKGLRTRISKPFFSQEHYALYQRYQHARHKHGGMDQDDETQYKEFLVDSQVDTYMIEFRESNSTNDLRMVSIIDRLSDGLSAVYTFYEPLIGQSYGTFNVLWQIEYAHSMGMRYLYLGYWVEQCQKMSYKTRFKPCELLLNGQWARQSP